jgi:hypothetical protein
MASSIADMIKQAKKDVGANSPSQPVNESTSHDEGIEIDVQNVEHVRGQAKSGDE